MKKLTLIIYIFLSINIFSQWSDFQNRFLLGQSYEDAGDLKKAKEIYEQLYKNQPENNQIFTSLNRIYIQLKEYDNSLKLIEEKIKENPTNINLYGELGTTYYLMGDETKAFTTWDNALKIVPQNENNYRLLANYAIQLRTFEKAIEYLQKGKKVSNEPKYFSYDLANLYSLTMRYEEATEEFCSIIEDDPNQLQNIESKILSYSDKPEALNVAIKVIEKRNYKENRNLAYLLSRLYIEANSLDKAFELVKMIDKSQDNSGNELFNFADELFSRNNFTYASKVYDYIIKNYPNSINISYAKLGYAKTLEASLDEEFNKENPIWKTYYIPKTINKSKYEELIKTYLDISKSYPDEQVDIESYFRIGSIYLNKLNDVQKAEPFFKELVSKYYMSELYSSSCDALAKIKLIENKPDSALIYYNNIVENPRSKIEDKNLAKLNIAFINFYKGNFSEAKKLLADITSKLDDNSTNDALELSLILNPSLNDSSNLMIYAKGLYELKRNNFDNSLSNFREIYYSNSSSLLLKSLSGIKFIECLVAKDEFIQAISFINEFMEKKDFNIYSDEAQYILAQIYQYGMKDFQKAIENYEKLLENFPNSLYLDNARKEILFLKNQIKIG